MAGKGREDPNDFPQLVTPAEGRGGLALLFLYAWISDIS